MGHEEALVLCLMSEATLPRIMRLLKLLESMIRGQDGNRMPTYVCWRSSLYNLNMLV